MHRYLLLIAGLLAATPIAAQIRDDRADADSYEQEDQLPPPPSTPTGRTADSGSGQIGQRQTREETAPNIEPLRRIDTRIANRVQSRIRNRIDRDYTPQANATSPFEVAGDRARTAGRRPPR